MFLYSHKQSIIARQWKIVVLSGVLFASLSAGATLFFPFEYRADAQVLIISKSRYGVDPYTVVKSAERVGENIAEVIKTDDFFDKVMKEQRYAFDRAAFQHPVARIRRRAWMRNVQASVVYGTGMLNVSAYGKTPDAATGLASAVVDTLASKGWEYVGGDVTIKVVNRPAATRFPVRPNMFLNAIFGFAAGSLLMAMLALKRQR
jgi:capsular polysaccharide biosynthesis protein